MMSTMEQMMEYLTQEGFRPQEEKFGISFKFEGANYLFVNNEEDEHFFQLALPGIFDITEQNIMEVFVAMDRTNLEQKVVKCVRFSDKTVWVFFEILLDSTPILDDIVPRALAMLKSAQNTFYTEISEQQQLKVVPKGPIS